MKQKYLVLSAEELQKFQKETNWQIDKGHLFRSFSFSSYVKAANFVQSLADFAEEQNHHPDILLTWRKVSVWLVTHDSDGITELDTKFALLTNNHFSSLNNDN